VTGGNLAHKKTGVITYPQRFFLEQVEQKLRDMSDKQPLMGHDGS